MKKNIFAVCDLEASYAYNFMEQINRKKNLLFEVLAFTSAESLCTFGKGHDIELLLISSRAMNAEVKGLGIRQVFILSDGEIIPEQQEYPAIYKYQSSTGVIREVMDYYMKSEKKTPAYLLKKKLSIYGVYSPIRRALKTSFAITLGQLLANERQVLYLNMEEFSGFEGLLEQSFDTDISDLIYYMKQDNPDIPMKLGSMVRSIYNLDFIPPAPVSEDLRAVSASEWLQLFDGIAKAGYGALVIDFGDWPLSDVAVLLEECRRIYLPVKNDAISRSKIEQYEKVLIMWGKEQLLGRTKKLQLPYHTSFSDDKLYVEQLVWSELGDFVRNLMREESIEYEAEH